METTTLLHFNFDLCRPIPTKLYNRVWEASDKMGQAFWGSEIHEELEDYLNFRIYEINK